MSEQGPTVHLGVPVVRPAEPRDVPRIAVTLTVALAESRWVRWALPVDGRTQRLTRLAELDAHRGIATGTTWVSEDVDAVASWQAPDGAAAPLPGDVAAALEREVPRLHADRADDVAATEAALAAALPAGPHWRLRALATRPRSRRRGLGGAVLAPVLDRCDRDGVPAALVAPAWAVVRFARALGFEVVQATRSTDDRLPLWVAVRPPRVPMPEL
ncbi:Acetyltransferase (GNAT) family protein [Geodermatophilus saharensis]|uniref:Acetyltransferase (GNAT) family protein n=1 Tax=Geodermatophilus saharensis TaxID=1137994 RepID=A0A239FQ51_9ACTN|nr:GNAT family N-acetyltransferase [Geodermatophilus saharensis]SNS59031.1 Acetyltransferase (GNAT) family protein [Geodermatophilus saharensis]